MTVEVYDLDTSLTVGSPEWWLKRLYTKITKRRPEIDFYDLYYKGEHPLPWLAPQARDEFRRILLMTRTNYMGLVCDSTVERANVEGFRLGGEEKADDETWGIWQSNYMDADFEMALLDSSIGGCSYTMVERNPRDDKNPRITVEHGTQAITECVPGYRRQRAAGLKLWVDDWTDRLCATLFLIHPTDGSADPQLYVYKYQAEVPRTDTSNPAWSRRAVKGEEFGARGDLDRIPLVPIENNPQTLTGGRSELFDLTDIQDRINKTVADRLITQDYGAYPQKWISAWPDEDDEGNQVKVDIGRNRVVTTDVAETKFGQWQSAPLDPYSMAKKEDAHDIAARSRTPAQYLLGEMNNVNGDTLKASESGLVSKVRQRMKFWGEGAEETVRIARIMAGLSSGDNASRMETIWGNPEYRTEGEVTDAAIKRFQTGIASKRQSREDVGYSQTQIQQLEKDDVREVVSAIPEFQAALRGAGGNGTQPSGVTQPVR